VARLDFHRQTGILTQEDLNRHRYTVIGAGGLGSPLAVLLAKLGVRDLTVWDDDVVGEENLASQFYRLADVGRPKVEALRDICQAFAGVELVATPMRFDGLPATNGIVITAVDSMAARREIWQRDIRYNAGVPLYLDARMGGQEGRVYSVAPCHPDAVDRYEASLYGDDEAFALPCTARAIAYNTAFLAGLIASQIQKYVSGRTVQPELLVGLDPLLIIDPQSEGRHVRAQCRLP
jgi:molybdopterin/thiamine biosynthesis adenylyltransferase